MRLDTYNTEPVTSVDGDSLDLARRARVVALASPSAVKCDCLCSTLIEGIAAVVIFDERRASLHMLFRAWVKLAGAAGAQRVAVAGIGATSGKAAQSLGLREVSWPDEPGFEGFLECILQTLAKVPTHA